MVENAKLERKAPLSTCALLLLHLLLESDRNRKRGKRERTRLYRRRRLALVDPHDGRGVVLEGSPYMDSSLSASSLLKGSFVPTASGLRYREKGRLIRSIFHFLSLKTLVDRRGTLGFLFSSLASLVTNPLFEFKSEKKVQGVEVYPLKMMWFMRFSGLLFAIMVMILFSPHFQSFPPAEAIRSSHHDGNLRVPIVIPAGDSSRLFSFRKASAFNNAEECGFRGGNFSGKSSVCDPFLVHVAITLDVHYLRGSMAAVHSILQHSQCPEDIFFHFLVSETHLEILVRSTFPQLKFKVYYFNPEIVRNLISTSVREALEHPLNYARNYLADLLEPCVRRVIYLDSDLIVVDDIYKLWSTSLGTRTIGAPEYCHANFTRYFTDKFWSEKRYYGTFDGRKPCYFNTGVIVIDLAKWRRFGFTKRIERWMEVQKNNRIYELGSLPPYLLVFAGHVAPIEHRWNQHGLGGDNVKGSCRDLHPGPVSLLHWSGSGKPWARLDMKAPCPIDAVWSPYDLYRPVR